MHCPRVRSAAIQVDAHVHHFAHCDGPRFEPRAPPSQTALQPCLWTGGCGTAASGAACGRRCVTNPAAVSPAAARASFTMSSGSAADSAGLACPLMAAIVAAGGDVPGVATGIFGSSLGRRLRRDDDLSTTTTHAASFEDGSGDSSDAALAGARRQLQQSLQLQLPAECPSAGEVCPPRAGCV